MIERLLRWIAVAIAVAAIVDPVATVSGRVRPRLAIALQAGPSMDLPSGAGKSPRRDVARAVAQQLTRDLASAFELVDVAAGIPATVVVVGDRYPVGLASFSGSISTVSTVSTGSTGSLSSASAALSPNVRLVSLDVPAAVLPATAVRIEATLEGTGVRGRTTTVVVQTAGFESGRVSHLWAADRERWRAGLDVVPVGAAPFTFIVAAEPVAGERTLLDNVGTARVGLAPPVRVLVFEARPSWASAFVRRALENDPRFQVSEIGRMSPTAVIVSGDERGLSEAALTNVEALIVGGLDAVSSAELGRLDRFMRDRGGALVLVPDSLAGLEKMSGASALRERFSLPAVKEVLLDRQAALAVRPPLTRIDTSELIAPVALPSDAEVLARMPGSGEPVIWTAPRGAGRLFFSGAMDAWRFRAESQIEFDRFWRSAIAGLALSASKPVSMVVAPGQVFVQVRDVDATDASNAVLSSALVSPANDGQTSEQPIRLLPDSGRGEFSGSVGAAPGVHHADEIVVTALRDGSTFAQRAPAEPLVTGVPFERPGPPLALLAATHGGIDVSPDRLNELERFVRSTAAGSRTPIALRPLRSTWWMLPFAACLAAEWWLRRRRGLR